MNKREKHELEKAKERFVFLTLVEMVRMFHTHDADKASVQLAQTEERMKYALEDLLNWGKPKLKVIDNVRTIQK